MKKKNIFRIKRPWQAVVAGIVAGILSVLTIICILAAVLVNYDIPSDYVKYLLIVPAVISGLTSGAVTGRYVKKRSFLWGCISAFSVSAIMLLVFLSINSFNIELTAFLLIPVFTLTGSIGGIISSNLK